MNATVTAMDARRRFGEILNSALYKGISTVIERKGRAIARIVPVLDDRAGQKPSLLTYAGIWEDAGDVARMKKTIAKNRKHAMRLAPPL